MNDSVKGSPVKVRLVNMTPKMAQKILDAGIVNWRKSKPFHVRDISDQLIRGEWELNGETIVLDAQGRCLDGLHRVRAIIRAGLTDPKVWMPIVLVTGVDNEKDKRIDCGIVRTLGEMLSGRGCSNVNILAGMARYDWNYTVRGIRTSMVASKSSTGREILCEHVMDNLGMADSAAFVMKYKSPLVSSVVASFVHYIGSKVGGKSDLADQFLIGVVDGVGVRAGSGPDLLRRKFERDRRTFNARKTFDKLILTVKAWNNFVAGDMNRQLKVGQRNLIKDGKLQLPEIKG
jgi:hypothetical protein